MSEAAARKLPDIIVHERLCKACSICVDFCPTNVLEIRGSCVAVRDLAACTRCQLCEIRCPDFAIQVSG